MSVSPISPSTPTPQKGQAPSDRNAFDTTTAPPSADRVEISDAAQAKTQTDAQTQVQSQAQAATVASVMPNARYWTPNLSPGQKGYVPQPLSAQFDKDGKAIKPSPSVRIDTQA